MHMHAIGSYLSTLRLGRKLGVGETIDAILQIAPDLEPNPNYLWRLEHGKIASPGARLLVVYATAVGGTTDDLGRLLLDRYATAEDGQRLAESRLAGTSAQVSGLPEGGVSYRAQLLDELRTWDEDALIELLIQIADLLKARRGGEREPGSATL